MAHTSLNGGEPMLSQTHEKKKDPRYFGLSNSSKSEGLGNYKAKDLFTIGRAREHELN